MSAWILCTQGILERYCCVKFEIDENLTAANIWWIKREESNDFMYKFLCMFWKNFNECTRHAKPNNVIKSPKKIWVLHFQFVWLLLWMLLVWFEKHSYIVYILDTVLLIFRTTFCLHSFNPSTKPLNYALFHEEEMGSVFKLFMNINKMHH